MTVLHDLSSEKGDSFSPRSLVYQEIIQCQDFRGSKLNDLFWIMIDESDVIRLFRRRINGRIACMFLHLILCLHDVRRRSLLPPPLTLPSSGMSSYLEYNRVILQSLIRLWSGVSSLVNCSGLWSCMSGERGEGRIVPGAVGGLDPVLIFLKFLWRETLQRDRYLVTCQGLLSKGM